LFVANDKDQISLDDFVSRFADNHKDVEKLLQAELRDEKSQFLKTTFQEMDLNNDSKLSKNEFINGMKEHVYSQLNALMIRTTLEQSHMSKKPIQGKGKHIMLSYNWKSQDLAKEICAALEEMNFKVWMDIKNKDGMASSVQLFASMARGVEGAAAIVVLLTPDYALSRNCTRGIRRSSIYLYIYIICTYFIIYLYIYIVLRLVTRDMLRRGSTQACRPHYGEML
jgi:hypothetical protein